MKFKPDWIKIIKANECNYILKKHTCQAYNLNNAASPSF